MCNADRKKKCSKCGKEKPLHEFTKDSSRVYGVYPRCKKCIHEYRVKRYKEDEGYRNYQKEYQKNYYNNKRTIEMVTTKSDALIEQLNKESK